MTTAMAGSVDVFRDKALMENLNQFLTGEANGSGAVCRTQSGTLRYMVVGSNVKSMHSQNERLTFNTVKGGTISFPLSACDMYRNVKRT